MNGTQRKRQTWLICLGLAALVLAAYTPLLGSGFINWDDPNYVTGNPHVQRGLTGPNLAWAFTTFDAGYWHPLTWLSHMLDCQLYGLNPVGHHLTSVLFHAANSILLFLFLRSATRAAWPSALVAALFALHPMHVESVAWISERKDVLSTFFWILSIWAYARYAENLKSGISNPKFCYIASLIFFAAGLMSKPMVVTLPFILLLLDYWPLQRRETPVTRLVVEKTPFFVMTAGFCLFTFLAVRKVGAVMQAATLPFSARLANAVVSYARYMIKTFWPAHLEIAHPLFVWPDWMIAGSTLILLLCSGLAWWLGRSRPWLMVGWLWFVGTLVPVIGLVQVGMHSMADRYSYVSSIGLFIAVAWTMRDFSVRLGARAMVMTAALATGVCLILTWRQAAFWTNSGTLFEHAIQGTTNNYIAYERLGSYEAEQGDTNAALRDLETSIKIKPDFVLSRDKLGLILLGNGRTDEALVQLRKAVALDPKFSDAHYNLGYALLTKGQTGDALDQFQAQVNLQPEDFKAQYNMGIVLLENGLAGDAIAYLQKAVEINPADAQAHYMLGNGFFRTGRAAEAIVQFEKTIELNSDDIQARNDLAWILACHPGPSIRNGERAVELALRADQLSGGQNPVITGTLAAGYAEAGRFSDAIAASQRAIEAAMAQTNRTLTESLEKRLRFYQAGAPWRDTGSQPAPAGK